MSEELVEEKIALAGGREAALTDDQLAIVGQDMTEIPSDIGNYAVGIRKLDFSWNSLSDLQHLEAFTELTSLVLDNNELTENSAFPELRSVETLWVNNNNISDLDAFLAQIEQKYPALVYLSMLKNPACPNFFTGQDSGAYAAYRRSVLQRCPQLRFLDAAPVSAEERQALPVESTPTRAGVDELPARPDAVRASFGVAAYQYVGKQSEGNRFILDSDL